MTTPAGRRVRRKHRLSRSQWAGALVAVAASLAALSLPGTARADTTGYDQMTGAGPTASALTDVQWTQGILDNNNKPIASANADRTNQSSPLWFMYQQFQSLSVQVNQTENLGHQGITVKWSGGQQTVNQGIIQGDYLQMMECWGDATTGPTPEQCEYGSFGLLPGQSVNSNGVVNNRIGGRLGPLCAAGTTGPSTSSPPRSKDGSGPSDGCDPAEPADSTHTQPCSGTVCDTFDYSIPFSPVTDPSQAGLDYGAGGPGHTTWFSQFNSNEVPEAVTSKDGSGQQQFETLTGVQAPGLGCGEQDNNSPRGCWLVIVPRGTYEPNGYQINPNGSTNSSIAVLDSSPLTASNWAQRIQIHLGYNPVGSFCGFGTLERPTFGTQMAARAMQSWQLALNQQANCAKVYGYSATFESTSTQNLQAGGDSGLAFTTIPIGSEAARDGNPPPTNLPQILYAPVAITALDFGFNINLINGYYSKPVELTPLLLAKALTQSYLTDLPDYYKPPAFPGPSWAQGNPVSISRDTTFQNLNAGTVFAASSTALAPLLTEDHSAENQQIWQWVQGSSAATAWLGGTKDANDANMVVDPAYQALHLGTPPAIDSFPRAYNGVLTVCEPQDSPPPCTAGQQTATKHTLDGLPYTDNYDSAAVDVLTGNYPAAGPWDPTAIAPDGSTGWWTKDSPQPIGQRFIWAADDTSDLAAYGLIPAQLCDDAAADSAANCVSPTVPAVTIAVGSATADSSGLLHVDPAHPGSGGYPLTQIIYAAVATNQSAAALSDYADLISFAAGTGQTAGSAPGDLPPGYLPLPSNLQTQAQAVATKLRALASPSPSTSTSSSQSSSSSQSPATTATTTPGTTSAGNNPAGNNPAGTGSTAGPTPAPGPAAAPTSVGQTTSPASALGKNTTTSGALPTVSSRGSTAPAGAIGALPPAEAAAGATPRQPLGAIRWALIAVAGAGGVFAVGGTLLRSGGMPTLWWRRRRLEWLE